MHGPWLPGFAGIGCHEDNRRAESGKPSSRQLSCDVPWKVPVWLGDRCCGLRDGWREWGGSSRVGSTMPDRLTGQ